MANSASQILDLIAPQYKTDPDKAAFIGLARGQTSTCAYGTNTEMAVALRAAHMLELRDRANGGGGGSGEVASKREGDLAISFHKGSGPAANDPDLSLTSFGKQLQGLTRGSVVAIGVTGGCDDGCAD